MRIRHATLREENGELQMYYPSQSKERNTECIYAIYKDSLIIAGQEIEKHPKFENVGQFEGWCNRYIAEKL